MYDVKGKVAFITGGARGIGKGLAEELLARGAKVCFVDINQTTGEETEKEFQKKYGDDVVMFLLCDITKEKRLRECLDITEKKLGKLNIMINNAMVLDEINFEKMIAIGLTAVIKGSYMACDRMRKDKGGDGGYIINIASIAALAKGPFMLAYTAVKSGVVGFTRCLAENLADTETCGVQAAALCPTSVDTDLFSDSRKIRKGDLAKDLYQPYFDEAFETIAQVAAVITLVPMSELVKVLFDLLELPTCNGKVVSVTSTGTKYHDAPLDSYN